MLRETSVLLCCSSGKPLYLHLVLQLHALRVPCRGLHRIGGAGRMRATAAAPGNRPNDARRHQSAAASSTAPSRQVRGSASLLRSLAPKSVSQQPLGIDLWIILSFPHFGCTPELPALVLCMHCSAALRSSTVPSPQVRLNLTTACPNLPSQRMQVPSLLAHLIYVMVWCCGLLCRAVCADLCAASDPLV